MAKRKVENIMQSRWDAAFVASKAQEFVGEMNSFHAEDPEVADCVAAAVGFLSATHAKMLAVAERRRSEVLALRYSR